MNNLEEVLNYFPNKNILVVGDILLDKFSWGQIDSLNPEQPAAPKVKIKNETYALGGAGNVANNVVSLKGHCTLYGLLGNDDAGEKIKEMCEKNNILLNFCYTPQPTLVKQRIMAHGQQITRLDHGEWNLKKINQESQEEIINLLEKKIKDYDFIIFSDYNKGFFTENFAQKIIALANSTNVPVLVDSKPSNIDYFKNCTIIRPNEKEAELITGIRYSNGPETLLKMGRELSKITNARYAVITCGGDGVFTYDKVENHGQLIPTKAKRIVDVAGAGDTFAAAFALSISSGLNIYDSSKLANYAAGNVVEKSGVDVTTPDELRERIKKDNI